MLESVCFSQVQIPDTGLITLWAFCRTVVCRRFLLDIIYRLASASFSASNFLASTSASVS